MKRKWPTNNWVEPDKRRFSIVDDDIRANCGHQAAVPDVLREGPAPMKRQYVHLTGNRELAVRVGARRGATAQ
jgi:RNA:NAD 2'-phosphotransferase (TPT1/KptA family)